VLKKNDSLLHSVTTIFLFQFFYCTDFILKNFCKVSKRLVTDELLYTICHPGARDPMLPLGRETGGKPIIITIRERWKI